MNTRRIALTVFLFLAASVTVIAADNDSLTGTWKLNAEQSKFSAGATKTLMVVYAPAGDQMKVTTEAITPDGKSVRTEWVGKFDGKDYPLVGHTNSTRAYRKVDARTMELINKDDGKVTTSGNAVVSMDGKTRVVTMKGTAANGKPVTYRAVYDKQ